MALKKPLVMGSDGFPQQLQSTDTLDAPQTGVDGIIQTNDEAGSIVIGAPVYNDVADGVKKARANAAGTSKVIGLVAAASIASAASGLIAVAGVLTATTGQWDAVTGGSGGLAVGTYYFLDPSTAGMLTSTPPSTVGQYVLCIGIALSTTEMKIDIKLRMLL